jgi:hypothetical protein
MKQRQPKAEQLVAQPLLPRYLRNYPFSERVVLAEASYDL